MLTLSPHSMAGYVNLFAALRSLYAVDVSRIVVDAPLILDPVSTPARINLADYLANQSDPAGAAKVLEEVCRHEPES
jgi:hypothetical protein